MALLARAQVQQNQKTEHEALVSFKERWHLLLLPWVLIEMKMELQRNVYSPALLWIHTLRVPYAHAAANLNWRYSKYAKVARALFCTIVFRTHYAHVSVA